METLVLDAMAGDKEEDEVKKGSVIQVAIKRAGSLMGMQMPHLPGLHMPHLPRVTEERDENTTDGEGGASHTDGEHDASPEARHAPRGRRSFVAWNIGDSAAPSPN